jgi:hypothetical protein
LGVRVPPSALPSPGVTSGLLSGSLDGLELELSVGPGGGSCDVEPAAEKELTMKIAVVGKGNVGGGLADLWEKAGHDIVARLGKDGGDVSDADVVLIAVPGGLIAGALDALDGIRGKTVIDATNLLNAEPPAGFDSNAEFVKSKTNGPTAKSFNLNYASQYGKLRRPSRGRAMSGRATKRRARSSNS